MCPYRPYQLRLSRECRTNMERIIVLIKYRPRNKERGPGFGYSPSAKYKDGVHQYDYDALTSNQYEWMRGYDIVDFHKLKRTGEILPFTTFQQMYHYSSASGSRTFTNQFGETSTYTPQWTHSLFNWDPSDAYVIDQLTDVDIRQWVNASAAKIYGSGWDALTFLAEIKQILSLVVQGLRTILTFLLKLKGKGLSWDELWLQYRYGWRILWYDMQDIRDLLANLSSDRKRWKEATGQTITREDLTLDSKNVGDATLHWSILDSWNISTRGTVVADIQPPKAMFNPFVTAWEKLTFSFILDWWFNIGQWLLTMSFLTFQQDYKAAIGAKVELLRAVTLTSVDWASGYSGTYTFASTSHCVYTVRQPESVGYFPKVEFNLDLHQLRDLMALVRSAL